MAPAKDSYFSQRQECPISTTRAARVQLVMRTGRKEEAYTSRFAVQDGLFRVLCTLALLDFGPLEGIKYCQAGNLREGKSWLPLL